MVVGLATVTIAGNLRREQFKGIFWQTVTRHELTFPACLFSRKHSIRQKFSRVDRIKYENI